MAISNTRLYGAAIAIVSGVYALGSASLGILNEPMMGEALGDMGWGGWIMIGIGVAVLIHGVVLLTPVADSLGTVSGPLMVVWAVVMLVDQWLLGIGAASSMMPMMEADPGMIAIAALMLISGLIMIARPMSREVQS